MKFSLKTLLLGFTLLGAMMGVMGKLWTENPELFFRVLDVATTVGPFLLAVVTIVCLGLGGEQRSHRLLVWGLLLLITPFAGQLARRALLPSGQPIRVLGTSRLLEKRLPPQINEPWVWNELEYRLGQGELTQEQVTASLQTLIRYLRTSTPQGWNQPLAWQSQFLASALQQGLVLQDVLVELSEVFYGTRPTLRALPPLPPGRNMILLSMEYGNPWAESSKLPVALLWQVSSVRLDEKQMPLDTAQMHFGRNWDARFVVDLEPGEHELVISADCALIDIDKLGGIDPNTTTPDEWPEALKRWQVEMRETVRVE